MHRPAAILAYSETVSCKTWLFSCILPNSSPISLTAIQSDSVVVVLQQTQMDADGHFFDGCIFHWRFFNQRLDNARLPERTRRVWHLVRNLNQTYILSLDNTILPALTSQLDINWHVFNQWGSQAAPIAWLTFAKQIVTVVLKNPFTRILPIRGAVTFR